MNNSSILITGGTGSFGNSFIPHILKNFSPKRVIVFSRDEMKQWEMAKQFPNEDRLRFFIGDVRDRDRLYRAMDHVDYVVHAAATKIVPTAEYNPFECIKTNINGAMNVVDAAIDRKVKGVVALSTDKASSPINLYGATKLASDKLFVSANAYSANATKFSVVRYGNVMGSRGSVIPFFESLKHTGQLPITDESMTRFMITLDEGVALVLTAFNVMCGGEIFVKKIPSMNILDIAKAVSPDAETNIVGLRPGEKLHEQMIGIDDAPFTFEFDDHYRILPQLNDYYKEPNYISVGKPVKKNFSYTSNENTEWMTSSDLAIWIAKNKELIGLI